MKTSLCWVALVLLLFRTDAVSSQTNPGQQKNTWRIMSYNIRNARGMDNVIDYGRIAEVINRTSPDFVALQEIDSVTGRSGGADVMVELARRTLMHPSFAAAIDHDGGKYGVGVLSREKPIRSYSVPLPGREEKRVLFMVEFSHFVLASTHLSLTEADRLEAVRLIAREAEKSAKPFIVAGDWNAGPESEEIARIGKQFKILTNPKHFTFPADQPQRCIDYIAICHSQADRFTKLRDWVEEEPAASDHRPVVVDLRLKAEKEAIFYNRPYLQNPVGGGITVMWQTTVPAYSWVEYGTDTLHLKKVHTLVDGQVICNDVHNKIRLQGLEPGQTYYYRVCSREITLYQAYYKEFGETAVTPFYSFTLPAPGAEDFTAVIFNDLHKQEATLNALYGQVKDIPYDFVVFNGDCIDDPISETEALFHLRMQCERVGAERVPVFYLRGNHEIRDAFSIGLRSLFDYVGDKTYGAFNWGDTRFVMLDCGEDKPDTTYVYYGLNDFTQLRLDQVGFLKEELAGSAFRKAGRHVLLNHIPLYGNSDRYHPCYDLWQPLLKDAPFDINLSAHIHRFTYHPKGEIENNFPVVTGGGPRMEGATVMVLRRKGKEMTLQVLNTKGETLLKLDL